MNSTCPTEHIVVRPRKGRRGKAAAAAQVGEFEERNWGVGGTDLS